MTYYLLYLVLLVGIQTRYQNLMQGHQHLYGCYDQNLYQDLNVQNIQHLESLNDVVTFTKDLKSGEEGIADPLVAGEAKTLFKVDVEISVPQAATAAAEGAGACRACSSLLELIFPVLWPAILLLA